MRREDLGHLRDVLAERLADAPCRHIRGRLGGDVAEGLDDILGAARRAAGAVAQAAPSVLKGAAAGFLTGGPAGAVVGGTLGALNVAPPATPTATPTATPGTSGTPAAPVANPAALELVLAVLRPEIVEALIALALGKLGAKTVPVAGVPVPVGAAVNLVQSLAEQALAAHVPPAPTRVPRFLAEAYARGEDIGAPEVRAESLRALLRESAGSLPDDEERLVEDDADRAADLRDLVEIARPGRY